MSMHMIKGVQVHGKSHKKRKKLDMKKVEIEWRQYNKDMRRKNMHSLQFDELQDYVDYISGNLKRKKKEFVPYEASPSSNRNTKSYPSLKTSDTIPTGSTARKEPQQYTGDLLVGIGVMHKSNLVPIMRGTDEAKDIANMRR
jgi:hypothetical protein